MSGNEQQPPSNHQEDQNYGKVTHITSLQEILVPKTKYIPNAVKFGTQSRASLLIIIKRPSEAATRQDSTE